MHYYFHYQAAYTAAIILHANLNLRLLRLVKQYHKLNICLYVMFSYAFMLCIS